METIALDQHYLSDTIDNDSDAPYLSISVYGNEQDSGSTEEPQMAVALYKHHFDNS